MLPGGHQRDCWCRAHQQGDAGGLADDVLLDDEVVVRAFVKCRRQGLQLIAMIADQECRSRASAMSRLHHPRASEGSEIDRIKKLRPWMGDAAFAPVIRQRELVAG